MGELDDLNIIDEKPKRRRQSSYAPVNRVWVAMMVFLTITFIIGTGFVVFHDSFPQYPNELEMTATIFVVNPAIFAMITATNNAIVTYNAIATHNASSTPAPLRTLQSIHQQQTPLAATQSALGTMEAQVTLTLTP
jgi:hypothetical protein